MISLIVFTDKYQGHDYKHDMFNKQFFNLLGFVLTNIFEIVPSLLFIDLFRHTYMSPIHHVKCYIQISKLWH